MKRPNDVIIQTVAKITVFIILAYALFLFFAGHHNPGGGFIGGLVAASAIVLLLIAFDIETVKKKIRIDYKVVAAVGVLIAALTGAGSFIFDVPFLTHTFGTIHLPLIGETELATAVLFDIGVGLAVVGTALNIIISISEDG